jgi:putative membrane protein insertion efficiency factor
VITGRGLAKSILRAPIRAYQLCVSPLLGTNCRHLPTCSQYAHDAIGLNGAWRGLWLTLARLLRCHPWGSSGLDPAPDIRSERHVLAPWRYGRWRKPT